jgi:hypothetical protein
MICGLSLEHDLFGKPASNFPDHGQTVPPTAEQRHAPSPRRLLNWEHVSVLASRSEPIASGSRDLCATPQTVLNIRLLMFKRSATTEQGLVRQRTQLINAIRGHLTEYGWIAPKGPSHVAMLAELLEEEEMASSLPEAARAMFRLMLDLLAGLDGKIADLDKEIARRAREDEVSRRLMTVAGIGPISATAITALAPPAETFAKGRDFAAWLGLTPLQRSTGGKRKLGANPK